MPDSTRRPTSGRPIGRGKDDTLFTTVNGVVKFEKEGRVVSVLPLAAPA